MKIAFFGAYGSFDFFRIGGTESFTRRLAEGLRESGHRADYVICGAGRTERQTTPSGIDLYYFTGLREALQHLASHYEHIVTIYLRPRDRLHYMYFRRRHRHRVTCHQVYFGWPDSLLRRKGAFLEARLYPFNGRLFCISPRIFRYVSRWSDRVTLFRPPVAASYFLTPRDKRNHKITRVTYIGRTDPGKGIVEVIKLFSHLVDRPEVEVNLHGLHHRNSADSERIHRWLSDQQAIRYFHVPFEGYSPQVDDNIRRILKETDILVLPYSRLSSTIDTPLLLLEGMASLCAVVTRSLGDIPATYGPSPFLLAESAGIISVVERILAAKTLLAEERERIHRRNQELKFDARTTTNLLLHNLS